MGIILGISFLLLLFLGVPIAISLGGASITALWFGSTIPLSVVAQRLFTATDSFSLLAIPLFMIAGGLMETGGISRRLIDFANALVGGFSGGLGLVSILSCMLFAAVSGSGPATVAAIGGIMIPYMVEEGYPPEFAAAIMAISGSMGIIIPPSIPMVTYGTISGESIGQLFTVGIVPGILVGLSLMLATWIISKKRGYGKSSGSFSIKRVWETGKKALWALMMPVIILGGIYGGLFTPTEAASVAVVYGLLIGFFVYKEIKWKDLPQILINAATTTAMIMFIIAAAQVFGWIMTSQRLPDKIATTMLGLSANKYVVLLLINLFLLIIGCFMETNAALILLVPIFMPVITSLGIDPLHFGIITVVNLAIGMATPPLGVNLFVATGIYPMKLERISKAVFPFVVANVLTLLLITFFPQISLFLANVG